MTRDRDEAASELYTRALSTMTQVLEALRDEPDPEGVLSELAHRIEGEREWVRALMVLGEPPRRPPGWLRRAPARAA
jgi:hypothetical protein